MPLSVEDVIISVADFIPESKVKKKLPSGQGHLFRTRRHVQIQSINILEKRKATTITTDKSNCNKK